MIVNGSPTRVLPFAVKTSCSVARISILVVLPFWSVNTVCVPVVEPMTVTGKAQMSVRTTVAEASNGAWVGAAAAAGWAEPTAARAAAPTANSHLRTEHSPHEARTGITGQEEVAENQSGVWNGASLIHESVSS